MTLESIAGGNMMYVISSDGENETRERDIALCLAKLIRSLLMSILEQIQRRICYINES